MAAGRGGGYAAAVTAADLAPESGRDPGRHLVLYDGVCGLCDRTVQLLLRADRRGVLTFAPLQGETAPAILRRHAIGDALQSLVLIRDPGTDGETAFTRSRAAFRIGAALGGLWRVLAWARFVVPRPLADRAYDFVAARRYRWFGRFDACRLPEPGVRERFLP
jgi:predicted DCC family thiol-disulfide oxidoreductase YuxK